MRGVIKGGVFIINIGKCCTRRNTKCTGSAQCPGYKAISEDEFRKRQKEQTKNKKKSYEDDCYWY